MKRWSTSYVNWQSQVKIKTIVEKNGTADLEQLHSEFQGSQGYVETLSQQNNIKQNKKQLNFKTQITLNAGKVEKIRKSHSSLDYKIVQPVWRHMWQFLTKLTQEQLCI